MELDNLSNTDLLAMLTICLIDNCIHEIVSSSSANSNEHIARVIKRNNVPMKDESDNEYYSAEYVCGYCGTRVFDGEDHCYHCGTKLNWEEMINDEEISQIAYKMMYDLTKNIAKEISKEEVEPGHWIVDTSYGNDVMSGESMVICSKCNMGKYDGPTNFCPNCGAKMTYEKA